MSISCWFEDVHLAMSDPLDVGKSSMVKGGYAYYHYRCDEFDDRGWGCGYRTLQTLCSWILHVKKQGTVVPSVYEIQKCLVDIGDKTPAFIGSREWIGSVEVAFCLEKFYGVQSRILHVRSLEELKTKVDFFHDHFKRFGSPIMMGGDEDCASKAVLGVFSGEKDYFLIMDPHNSNSCISKNELFTEGWICWRAVDSFDEVSFYNFCCPLLKAAD